MSWKSKWSTMNAYDIHKSVINEYILTRQGKTSLLKRDISKDITDFDVVRQNHQFLWDDNDNIDTWEKRVAKKYYDRLFKEYCVGDLSNYKVDKFGFRWRTEKELIDGKGQFTCGERKCPKNSNLRTWEVNFGYMENGVKKNALVKLRLCHGCGKKLNYRFKRKEAKKLKHSETARSPISCSSEHEAPKISQEALVGEPHSWQHKDPSTAETEDIEIDEFLQDLFL